MSSYEDETGVKLIIIEHPGSKDFYYYSYYYYYIIILLLLLLLLLLNIQVLMLLRIGA